MRRHSRREGREFEIERKEMIHLTAVAENVNFHPCWLLALAENELVPELVTLVLVEQPFAVLGEAFVVALEVTAPEQQALAGH